MLVDLVDGEEYRVRDQQNNKNYQPFGIPKHYLCLTRKFFNHEEHEGHEEIYLKQE